MYAMVVLCINNLDCGDAVDSPHIHIWGCEDAVEVQVHMP